MKSKTIIDIVLILLASIFIALDICYVYMRFIQELPITFSGAFISQQEDPSSGKVYPMLDIVYYSNQDGRGKELLDVSLNGYSESSYQTIYSRGFQLVDGVIYPYESNNGQSWQASSLWQHSVYDEEGNKVIQGDLLNVKIDNENYAIALDGRYSEYVESFDFWQSIGNGFKAIFTDWGMFDRRDPWFEYYEVYHYYTFEDFLEYCKTLAKSLSTGYGDTYIPAIDLGDFFGLYKVDDNGRYENVISYEAINQTRYYFDAQIHYDYRGVQYAKQSLFGSVAGDSEYNTGGVIDTNYWQISPVIKLGADDFEFRTSNAEGGDLISLKSSKLYEINSYSRGVECDLIINLDELENVVGLDWYAFDGVNLKNLVITSSSFRTFVLNPYSLNNVSLDFFEKSDNVYLDCRDNFYNGEVAIA